jgi:hypothetical protein
VKWSLEKSRLDSLKRILLCFGTRLLSLKSVLLPLNTPGQWPPGSKSASDALAIPPDSAVPLRSDIDSMS